MYEYNATLVRVVDGDTIDVMVDLGFDIHHKARLRLARINAPELNTSEGQVSRFGLLTLLGEAPGRATPPFYIKTKKVPEKSKDKYGRFIAEVYVQSVNISDRMINQGFAVYVNY